MTDGQVVAFHPPADSPIRERWVNERTVARHFGVSDRQVRRWRAQGMPSRLIGGARRYRIGEAERWHETQEGSQP